MTAAASGGSTTCVPLCVADLAVCSEQLAGWALASARLPCAGNSALTTAATVRSGGSSDSGGSNDGGGISNDGSVSSECLRWRRLQYSSGSSGIVAAVELEAQDAQGGGCRC